MPQLRNVATGAVVSVPEEKVARLGSDWVPAEEGKPTAKPAAKPAASKSEKSGS